MPQGWLPTAPDQRTFALQQQRTLEDLNRPELQSIVQQYLQDAIRYYQRKPFFFNDTDNTTVPGWAAGTYYTQGATLLVSDPARQATIATTGWLPGHAYVLGDMILDSNGNVQTVIVAGLSGAVPPVWMTTAFAQTVDNAVTWEVSSIWAANTDVPVGLAIFDSNGNIQVVVVAGTTGMTTPIWATTAFGQTQDGTAIWEVTSIATTQQLVVVNLIAGLSGATEPIWTQTLYTPPSNLRSPPTFLPPVVGTNPDNQALWATVALWTGPGIYTQLSTVPSINQYVPPIDLIAPKRIEVTWSANLRIGMTKLTYDELRDYDVIRPTPPTTYPSYWAWWQQQIYFWPYPVGFYPITLSYRTAPPLPRNATDSNFWTTTAEGLIRHYATGRILENVVRDAEGAQEAYDLANRELAALIGMRIQQDTGTEGSGIPPAPW